MASTATIKEAIAKADAELNNVGLPTYSELYDRFLVVESFAARYPNYQGGACQRAAEKIISQLHKAMA